MALVVVGASLAGLRAVEAARRDGYRGRIVLIGAEDHPPYDRLPLSKSFLATEGPGRVDPFHTEAALRDEFGVELLLGAPADGLDTATREVSVGGTTVPYDALVIATGATARRLPGSDGITGVHALRTAEDALAVRAALDDGARTVVIGAGFIGSEVAAAARKRGLPATIVEALDVPLTRSVGAEAGAVCASLHREAGTELRLSTTVTGLEAGGGAVTGVRLSTGEVLPRIWWSPASVSSRPPAGWRGAGSRCTSATVAWCATRRFGPGSPACTPPGTSRTPRTRCSTAS